MIGELVKVLILGVGWVGSWSSRRRSLPVIDSAELPPGRRSALLIGTGIYMDARLSELRGARRDVEQMDAVLGDPNLGGFEVTAMVDPGAHELRTAVERFLVARAYEETVVVYLSCHGVIDKWGDLCFAVKDTDLDLPAATGLESEWLRKRMDRCPARRQVVILDCCHAGLYSRSGAKGADGAISLKLGSLARDGRGRVVLHAARAAQSAYEPAQADQFGSVYTTALVEGLRSGAADHDRDGFVSVVEAHSYAENRLLQMGAAQTPRIELRDGEGTILLTRSPAGRFVEPATASTDALTAYNGMPDELLAAINELIRLAADKGVPRISQAAQSFLTPSAAITPDIPPFARVLRHDRPVWAVAFAPDGGTLATISGTTTVRLWEPHTGEQIDQSVNRHTGRALAVAFSRNGATLVTSSNESNILVWDPHTGRKIGKSRTGHSGAVSAAAISPDGRTFATIGGSTKIYLWDALTVEKLGEVVTGHTGHILAMAFSPDSTTLATSGNDGTVRLWNARTRQQIGETFTNRTGQGTALTFTPDGGILATSTGNTARLWGLRDGRFMLDLLGGHTGAVRAMAFSPDRTMLATGSEDQSVRLWDPRTGQQIGKALTGHTSRIKSVAFSPDGNTLATAGSDGTAQLWAIAPITAQHQNPVR